eukprot:5078625-Prymnesium_polylepis.2
MESAAQTTSHKLLIRADECVKKHGNCESCFWLHSRATHTVTRTTTRNHGIVGKSYPHELSDENLCAPWAAHLARDRAREIARCGACGGYVRDARRPCLSPPPPPPPPPAPPRLAPL